MSISLALLPGCVLAHGAEVRFGIVGTDSTHAVEFTRILNDVQALDHVPGARVTAAYRGGSARLAISRDRIDGITKTLRERWSLPFVSSIEDLCPTSDALLLLSVDVSLRMQELQEVAACGKPVFIDKPLAGSLSDAKSIVAFLDSQHVPWFSSSSLRYGHPQTARALDGAETWGPGKYTEGFPLDLAYYGIHSIESLISYMGTGVVQVSQLRRGDAALLELVWADGRIGTVRLTHSNAEYGALLFLDNGTAEPTKLSSAYAPLLSQIVMFAQSGRSPVQEAETLEIFFIMQAAEESLKHQGTTVSIY